jgi:UDPglucose 6-dehydrogenase
MKISIVGFGKLGSALAAAFVSRHEIIIPIENPVRYAWPFWVYAFDKSSDAFTAPLQSTYPEPQVSELLSEANARGNLELHTMDNAAKITDTSVTFVIVPTPSLSDGSFDTNYCIEAMLSIGEAIKDKDAYHLVVLSSTVMPSDCETKIIPALELAAGRKLGDMLGFCYSPAFIAQGSVVDDFLDPDFVLIGGNELDAERLKMIYEELNPSFPGEETQYALMSISSAEVTKLALNTYITLKISFANTLAVFCHRTPGAHVDDVTGAMGLDSRVSPKFFKGATGYGGPCFPRDGRAMIKALDKAELWNGYAGIPYISVKINQVHVEFVGELAREVLPEDGSVLVLGAAYKVGTPITEESFGLALADYLALARVEAMTIDPTLDGWSDFDALVRQADVIVVALPYTHFQHLPYQPGQTIIDCWRSLDPNDLPSGVRYVPLGVGK